MHEQSTYLTSDWNPQPSVSMVDEINPTSALENTDEQIVADTALAALVGPPDTLDTHRERRVWELIGNLASAWVLWQLPDGGLISRDEEGGVNTTRQWPELAGRGASRDHIHRTHYVGADQTRPMPISSLTDPPLDDALDLLDTGFERGGMLTLVGECEVDYDGRASSHLPPGERLVILKPDGTLLVHRDEQRKPVNWQPPGSTHSARIDGDRLIVESVRTSPHEEIEIAFETVAQVSLLELDDGSDLALEGSEEDLRKRILANPDVLEPGFKAMATERETAAGAIDIYGEDADGTPTAVELKRRRVGPDAVGQLNRYVEALERNRPGRTIRGVLVAPSVTDRAERLLTNENLEFVSLTPDEVATSKPTHLDEFTES